MTEQALAEDELGPDMMVMTAPAEELRVLCLLLVGGLAELVVDGGDPDDVLRHPAAEVAAQAGVSPEDLPGRMLLVTVAGDGGELQLSGFRLVSDA